jgi:predicted nucleic acid-binding protein
LPAGGFCSILIRRPALLSFSATGAACNHIPSDAGRRLQFHSPKRHELIARHFFPIELIHAMTRSERKKPPVIQVGEAELFWLDMTTPPEFIPTLAVAHRAIQLSSQTKAGAYDWVSAAIAEPQGCELITADAEMVK